MNKKYKYFFKYNYDISEERKNYTKYVSEIGETYEEAYEKLIINLSNKTDEYNIRNIKRR